MRAQGFLKVLNELKLALVLVPILAIIFSAIISVYVLTPLYRSSTTLMVFKQPTAAEPYEVRIGTITLNQKLVKTYSELAQSRVVYEEIIKQNNLPMTVEELRSKITVETLGETELLRITADSTNPTLSAMLANETARILLEKVAELMVLDNIQIINTATPSSTPVWPNHTLNMLLAGVIGLLLVVGVALLRTNISDYQENNDPELIIQPVNQGEEIELKINEEEHKQS